MAADPHLNFDLSPLLGPIFGLLLLVGVIKILSELGPALLDHWLSERKKREAFEAGRVWRTDRQLIQWLRGMRPSEFEEYIEALFTKLGYKAEKVGGSHDGGIDVIAQKDGITHFIQCKKFITSEVRVGDVRDFYGAIVGRNTQGDGYFITTNKFTLEARRFAEDKPVELIDSFKLLAYIRMAEKEGFDFERTSVPDRKCPECGGNLVERDGKFGKFLGCDNYPKCRHTSNT